MPAMTDLDRQVEDAILRDDRVELEKITTKYTVWKRRYAKLLFTYNARKCMDSFVASSHTDVARMAHMAARYTESLWVMKRMSHLPQVTKMNTEGLAKELVDILWARTDLTPGQAQDLARVIVGMEYVR